MISYFVVSIETKCTSLMSNFISCDCFYKKIVDRAESVPSRCVNIF